MAQKIINIGTTANDGTGDTLRGAFANTNNNFTDLYVTVNSAFEYANAIALANGDPIPAFDKANAAFTKANSANVLAFQTGVGANAWANSVSADACNFTISIATNINSNVDSLSIGANAYAVAVGNSVNISSRAYANTRLANTSGVSFNGDLYFPSGNIAVGTIYANSKLHIIGATTERAIFNFSSYSIPTPTTSTGSFSVWNFTGANGGTPTIVEYSFVDNGGTYMGGFKFSDTQAAGDWVAPRFDMIQRYGAASEIRSQLNAQDPTWAGMKFTSQTTGNAVLTSSPAFVWFNYNTEMMRITANANVLIGTTSTLGYTLDIGGLGSVNAASYYINGSLVRSMDYAFANGTANAANTYANNTFYTISNGSAAFATANAAKERPVNAPGAVNYVLIASDAGKTIAANATVFVPNAVFFSGNVVHIYNNTATAISITPNNNVTLVNPANSFGTRTLSANGYATLACIFGRGTGQNVFSLTGSTIT